MLILPVRAAGKAMARPIAPDDLATARCVRRARSACLVNPGRRSGKPDSAVALPAAPAFSGSAVRSDGRQGNVGKLHQDWQTDFAGNGAIVRKDPHHLGFEFPVAAFVIYPVHARSRKTFGSMTRKLSVTESRNSGQRLGTCSRRKVRTASAKSR